MGALLLVGLIVWFVMWRRKRQPNKVGPQEQAVAPPKVGAADAAGVAAAGGAVLSEAVDCIRAWAGGLWRACSRWLH